MSNHRSEAESYAEKFKALSNPHRLAIFAQLMEQCCASGSCCGDDAPAQEEGQASVGELAHCCDIAPSTLSHHLKELRTAGLLKVERQGKYVHCWVEQETLDELSRFFRPADGSKEA